MNMRKIRMVQVAGSILYLVGVPTVKFACAGGVIEGWNCYFRASELLLLGFVEFCKAVMNLFQLAMTI